MWALCSLIIANRRDFCNDGTEQVIEQPYLEIGGQKFPDENNGCEMCHPGEDCEKCRMNAMLKVFRLDG